MSLRLNCFKKSLLLLSAGTTFAFNGFGLGWQGLFNCDRNLQNSDLVTFYQGVGGGLVDTGVNGAFDAGLNSGLIGSDFDAIFRKATVKLFESYWNNFAFLGFPVDPSKVPVVKN